MLWTDHLLPRVINLTLGARQVRETRERVCRGLAGEVLEIGFGSGLNLPALPATVTRVLAVEPSAVAVRLARERIEASPAEVRVVGLDGARIPLPDASADAALCTFTLCTVPDPVTAAREVRRVLRPGGLLHFVEHGRAPDEGVLRWQRRLNGVQRRLFGGCHLDRDIAGILVDGGLHVTTLERYYGPAEPRPYAAMWEGKAQAPFG